MRNLILVVCLIAVLLGGLSGCGSASATSSTASSDENVIMQGGQWEYVVTPQNGIKMYFGTNLPTTNANFSASNLVIFQPSQISLTQNIAPISCEQYSINGAIGGMEVDAKIATPTGAFASFSGQLSADGQSISNGKYTGQACTVAPSNVTGTLTGYTVAPLNGTFTGTLTSSAYGASVMTVDFEQAVAYTVKIAGTFVENGVTTSFTDMPGTDSSLISGASLFFGVDAVNVNGKSQFTGLGHMNPTGTQIDIYLGGPNETIIGTLTKQ
jgi:hypothetical protein